MRTWIVVAVFCLSIQLAAQSGSPEFGRRPTEFTVFYSMAPAKDPNIFGRAEQRSLHEIGSRWGRQLITGTCVVAVDIFRQSRRADARTDFARVWL